MYTGCPASLRAAVGERYVLAPLYGTISIFKIERTIYLNPNLKSNSDNDLL